MKLVVRWAQVAFGQVVGGINAVVIQKGKEMIALFIEPFAHGFFVRFAAGRFQQFNGFILVGPKVAKPEISAK